MTESLNISPKDTKKIIALMQLQAFPYGVLNTAKKQTREFLEIRSCNPGFPF
jgi:hypothetical protein